MGNVGWSCQGGWGIIDENCDCVEYIEPENCLEGLDTDFFLSTRSWNAETRTT